MQQWIENDKTGRYELVDELGTMYQALSITVADMLCKMDADALPEDLIDLITQRITEVAIA